MIRRRPATPADDVQESAPGELLEVGSGVRGTLVVLAEGVRQPGVRIAAHRAVRDPRELGHVRPHVARSQCAVDADAERPGVSYRHPEGIDRLARQRAPAAIGHRGGNHQRQADALLLEQLLDGNDGCLGVERVDDRFEQQQVAAAIDEAAHLLPVGVAELVERHVAEGRVVDVRRDRQDPGGRSHRAGDEPGLVGRPGRPLIGGRSGQPGRREVQFVHERLEPVVRLGDGVAAEGVGLDDVAADLEILAVDTGNHAGLCEHEQIVVASEIPRVAAKAVAAEVRLGQGVALNHRPHRPVEEEDAFREHGTDIGLHRDTFGACGLVPEAISTANGSPALREPTPMRTSRRPADASSRASSSSRNPRRRSPSFARTHSSP